MSDVVLHDEEARILEGIEDVEHGWRKVAAALRTIRNEEAWKQDPDKFKTYQAYYEEKWEAKLRVKFNNTRELIRSLETVEEMEATRVGTRGAVPTPESAKRLATIEDPEERSEFWEKAVLEQDRPHGRIPSKELRERLTRYKQAKKQKTAGEVLSLADWESLPSPELTPEEKFVGLYPAKIMVTISKLHPEGCAQARVHTQRRPNDIVREVEKTREIIEWFTQYEEALNKHLRKGIHAVEDKSKEGAS